MAQPGAPSLFQSQAPAGVLNLGSQLVPRVQPVSPVPIGQNIISNAKAYLGVPYVWGGGHSSTLGPSLGAPGDPAEPNAPHMTGLDCSGLVISALGKAGIHVGGTAADIEAHAPIHPPLNALQPGDLLFYENGGHVAIYAGAGQVIQAAHTGTNVEFTPITEMGAPSGTARYTGAAGRAVTGASLVAASGGHAAAQTANSVNSALTGTPAPAAPANPVASQLAGKPAPSTTAGGVMPQAPAKPALPLKLALQLLGLHPPGAMK